MKKLSLEKVENIIGGVESLPNENDQEALCFYYLTRFVQTNAEGWGYMFLKYC